jgi:hypothetical protein
MATRPRISRLGRFWEHDHGLSLLAAFLAVVMVGAPVVHLATPGRLVMDLALSVLLLTGVTAVSQGRAMRTVLAALAGATLVTRFAYSLDPDAQDSLPGAVTAVAFFALLAFVVASRVFRDGDVSVHRILGAVALYLILGLTWTFAYEWLALVDPGAFAFAVPPVTPAERTSELVYFSFVTLTTVGYGDITAVHPLARSLAMLEAVTGQLFIAITLARLVALEVGRPR